jgi:beta-galactosidase/beta-glucuronidase
MAQHNPPDPALLDILDTLGVLVWDETRDFTLAQVRDMEDLVKRDRNHPSIILWSMGNEAELQDPSMKIGPAMRRAVLALDTSRPITANMNKPSSPALTTSLDVQGVSHSSVPGTPVKMYRDANCECGIPPSEFCSVSLHPLTSGVTYHAQTPSPGSTSSIRPCRSCRQRAPPA